MPNSFDLDGRSPSNGRLFIVGVCFVSVAAVAVMLAIAKSKGDLDPIVRVTADLVNVGDGLPEKSDVKFRGVLVGHVADVITAPVGEPNVVHINLKPEYASGIPDTVTARVVPSNVFAVSSVQLIDNETGGAPVHAGAVIPEDTSLRTVLFQSTLSKFRKVFAALSRQPTDNGSGILATITEATHGRGAHLHEAGRDLNKIVTQLNTVIGDGSSPSTISTLADAADALRDVSPDLFNALTSAVAPMRTLSEKRSALTDFLSAGVNTAGTLGDAFENQTSRLINITTQLSPVLGVLADNDKQFHPIASRIQQLGQNMLSIYDPDTHLFAVKPTVSFAPTRTYVRADCPRYGELAGPSCQTAPELPTAPGLYPALGSMGYPPPAGVTENRPNLAPPRDSMRHAGEVPGGPEQGPLPEEAPQEPPASGPPLPAEAGTAGYQERPAAIGGNVGPVGSPQERQQLGLLIGGDANAATQLLLGPVVRGSTVQLVERGGAR